MSEGTVDLHRHVPLLVAEGDVRTHHGLGRGLAADLFFVIDVVPFAAVLIDNEAVTVGQIEHAELLAHNLIADVAGAVEACAPE